VGIGHGDKANRTITATAIATKMPSTILFEVLASHFLLSPRARALARRIITCPEMMVTRRAPMIAIGGMIELFFTLRLINYIRGSVVAIATTTVKAVKAENFPAPGTFVFKFVFSH
jgi:hypothetical protein